MINLMLSKFLQRKFWLALSGAVALFVGDGLGMPVEAQILGGIIMGVWIVVEGALDLISIKMQNEQLRQVIGQMHAQAQRQAAGVEKAKAAARGDTSK